MLLIAALISQQVPPLQLLTTHSHPSSRALPFHLVLPWHRNHNASSPAPLSCCCHAQDMKDQRRYSSLVFKRHPTKALEVEGGNGKCGNVDLVVCTGFQQKGWFPELKHGGDHLHSQQLYMYTNQGITGKLIKETS